MDEFKTAEAGRRLATVVLSPGEFGWPLVAPPGVPGNRVVELRDAFMRAMADPELIAEAKKRQLDPTPSSGGELEALAKEVIAQPRDVVERMKVFLGN
jgi:tripartite-type tricarboxylate transporter receptor subunit TctC